MFSSSLPPVVCRWAHVLFTLMCLFVYSGAQHLVLCYCFVYLRLVCPLLPVSLDCPFLIAPSVFSNFYSKAHFRAELLLELTLFKSFYEWAEASLMMSNFILLSKSWTTDISSNKSSSKFTPFDNLV